MLSTDEAAKYLGYGKSTLDKLRCKGGGPRYIAHGRRVTYDPDDLDEWINARKRSTTSEEAHNARAA
jgi:excisionase family DNA binding protein